MAENICKCGAFENARSHSSTCPFGGLPRERKTRKHILAIRERGTKVWYRASESALSKETAIRVFQDALLGLMGSNIEASIRPAPEKIGPRYLVRLSEMTASLESVPPEYPFKKYDALPKIIKG